MPLPIVFYLCHYPLFPGLVMDYRELYIARSRVASGPFEALAHSRGAHEQEDNVERYDHK